jgi:acetyltransferase
LHLPITLRTGSERWSNSASRADYPAQWQRSARTRDGIDYRIRPILIEDAEGDRAFIIHLSEASRYKRMMGSLREPIIGVARYSAVFDKTDAEFAVAVADEWQSQGIGMTLLRLLFEYAKGQGVRRLHALIFANDDRMLDLARKLQLKISSLPDDPSVLEAAGDL